MTKKKNRQALSAVRAAAGRAGAEARWGGRTDRATACLRVYPADAEKIRRLAQEQLQLPADIVAAALRRIAPEPGI